NMPISRRIMLKFATLFLRIIYGLNLTDAHNGLRLFKKDCALKIAPSIDNFVHASEIPYLIKKSKLKYKEIPVKIKYTEYSLSKGQKTSNFIRVGKYTILHKLQMIFFDK
nr:glycosyltransferase family 2 protein [Spirochaetota bacterium]